MIRQDLTARMDEACKGRGVMRGREKGEPESFCIFKHTPMCALMLRTRPRDF